MPTTVRVKGPLEEDFEAERLAEEADRRTPVTAQSMAQTLLREALVARERARELRAASERMTAAQMRKGKAS